MRHNFAHRLLRMTVFLALLSAISIVCGKYLAFNMGDFLRFSFENLPIIFAGMAFGPIAGAVVGVVADLIGCVLVGYAINPLITLGAAAIGAVSGIYIFLPTTEKKGNRILQLLLTVASAHLVGSVLIKSFGLSVFYSFPVYILMLWRLLNYLIVGAVEGVVLYHLLKNRALRNQIKEIKRETH